MLQEFDHARRELVAIRDELKQFGSNQAPTAEQQAQAAFFKARALDLLRHIYVDSEATLKQIAGAFNEASTLAVLEAVERALKVGPPLRRALGSEDDLRAIQVLIDAAVWRSKFVWACGLGVLIAGAVTLAVLGFDIRDVSKQAEAVRQQLADQRVRIDQAIAAAKLASDQNVLAMNNSVSEIEKKRLEIEAKRKEIVARVDEVQGSDNIVTRVVARLNAELARLAEVERNWLLQREKLTADLARHAEFLTGKEVEVTGKMTAFGQLLTQQAANVDTIFERARNTETLLTASATTSSNHANTIAALVAPAQAAAGAIEQLRGQADASSEKTAAARQSAEEARDRIYGIEQQLKELASTAAAAKGKIDALLDTVTQEQTRFGTHLVAQRAIVDGAAAGVATAKEAAIGNVNQAARQAIDALATSHATANRQLQFIQTAEQEADVRSASIRRTNSDVAKLQTEITIKLEELKTEEERLKGERARARAIINVVEDKRGEIADKLRTLLAQAPDLDFAVLWKLVLASNVLMLLLGLSGVLLLILVVIVGVRLRMWIESMPKTTASP